MIGGTVRSAWIDGAPWGVRVLPDGSTIDLGHVINTANCQKTTVCSAADMSLVTPDRPWGANNPRWVLYAYGPVRALLPSHSIDSPYYVVLLAGAAVAPEGWRAIALRAEAFGPSGAHAVVGAAVGRAPGQIAPKVLFWREVR